MLVLLSVLLAGAGVLATSPRRPPPKCPFPTGPYVQPKCGPNEYFEVCSYPYPAQNCSTLWTNYSCPEACCKPECRCKDGFLRDDKSGKCIRRDECFKPCGPLEHFVQGSSECRKTCANYKVTGPQSLCKPFTGCVCNEGRVRLSDDGTGVCVLPQKCPARKCPIFEHFEDCPSVCQKETCISKSQDYQCLLPAIPLPCKPRCICDKGYLRDTFGQCIPESHCPVKTCPINEVWRCASMCPRDSCKTLESGFKCPPGIISVCIPACACKDGYLRNEKGLCVPKKLCPASLRCGINEVAVDCATPLPLQSCESVYTLYKPVKDVPCKSGCDCRPGYLRNNLNICVPSEFCPTVPQNQCGPNQEYKKCGTACEPSCADLDNPNQICTDQCVAGCFCKDGYRKDGQGNCITRDQCPLPVCTQPNEVATDCGSSCNDRNCDDYKRTDIVCPAVCIRGCFCKPGYVRNAYGICISPDQCPPEIVCLQANEEYQSCGSSCPDNCDNYLDTGRICTQNCVPGCNCKQGFVRNLQDKTCVKPDQCPSKNCTGLNEYLNLCASYCPVTCANRFTNGDWLCATVCRVACDCIRGTLRNDSGVCVPVEQCTPPVCRQNEKYLNCGTACPLTCDNYKNPPTVCTRQCVEDCFCEDGYVKDRNMRCVKPEECEPICPAGEKFNECSAHCQDTCENYDKPDRICTYQCQSGCVCEASTVRRKDGKCVPPLECSPQPTCANATEVYSPCSAHCEPTCENSSPNQPCTRICKPGCKCIDGLVRRKDGQCVKVGECSPEPSCPAQEVYDPCSAHCEPTCENNGPNRPCTDICSPGCKCKDGLVRRSDGVCVKLEECQNTPKCPINERWVNCVIGLCAPQTCDELGFPIACADIIGPCKGGCVCAENYLRDSQGVCIPQKSCPSCGGDFNATSGCGINCGHLCSNYNKPNNCSALPLVCQYNGCDCKGGYVFDDVTEKCILPCDCLPQNQCGPNQEYKKCGTACEPSCADLDNPNQICTDQCVAGCFCKDGYRKDGQGNCITRDQCPLPVCTQPNEVATDCGSSCNDRNCDDYKRTDIVCPAVCIRGCFCKPGYVRNASGICISPDQCPPEVVCLQANEEYQSCGSSCPDNCDNYQDTGRICTQNCVPGCNCKQGFVRNLQDKTCVKPDKCPINIPCSDPNAEKVECATHCPSTCANPIPGPCAGCTPNACVCKKGYILSENGGRCVPVDQCPKDASCNGDSNAVIKANPLPCPSTCAAPNAFPYCKKYTPEVGCECKPGYLKSSDDINGKCIKPEECTGGNPCGVNGTFVWCNAGCPTNYCPVNDNRGIIACSPPYPCPSGCACKLNYRKKTYDDLTCILASDCPPVKCTRQNEVWSPCPSACLRENCADVNDQPTTCNTLVLNCQPQCICKKGYFRNDNDLCVPANQCPNNKCSDPNAERSPCASQCPPTCSNKNPGPCIQSCAVNECVCKKGFILSEKGGKCIPADQCPANNNSCSDPNAERIQCAEAPQCRSTCAAPDPGPCILSCAINECVCKKGFLLSEKGGKCVPVDQCPKDAPCNGDSNAVIKANPLPCPSTCAAPNADPYCKKYAPKTFGCECKPGYLKSDDNRKCIKPDDCKGGNPCGVNGTFVWCNAGCPTDYCPVNDNRGIIACSPPYPCPSGCACKLNHRKKSYDDITCILASDCPPVKCTRQNEVWSPCPSACLQENCADVNNQPTTCNTLILNCQPQCICKKGYFRNDDGFCIPAKQCPNNNPCSDPNAERSLCASECPPTCAKPNPGPCVVSCSANACVCKKGFILSEKGGKCIPADKCPANNKCSDLNAERSPCASQCPPTCSNKNPGPCIQSCAVNECVCKKGFILSEKGGKCIPADKCPANPIKCKANEVYNPCRLICPPQTCESPYSSYNCQNVSNKCEPGCDCISEYLRNGTEKDLCIPSSQCPPPKPACGLNEHYEVNRIKCDLTCKTKDFEAVIGPCQAASGCFCDDGFYRNTNGICVTKEQCPKRIICPANEVLSECYNTCLTTCRTRIRGDGRACPLACVDSGCVCKPDYLRHDNGTCVPINECSPPRCNENETYSSCGTACPETCLNKGGNCTTSCTKQCVEGCFCCKGFVRADDETCVKPKDCPKPTCSDPNEVFDKCPPTCPPGDDCSNLYSKFDCSKFEKCCKPACRCKPGYFRKNGKCITRKQCENGGDATEAPEVCD